MNQKGLTPMVRYNVRMEQTLKDQLEFLAARDRRQTSEYVRLVLADHVEKELQKLDSEKRG